jgi:hypothetical protein
MADQDNEATPYDEGYDAGLYRSANDDYDPRWDFADAAKEPFPYFKEFKRGFEDGFDGRERTP